MRSYWILGIGLLGACRTDISLQEVKSRVAPRGPLVDVGEVPLGEAHDFTIDLLHLAGGEVAVRSVDVASAGDAFFVHDGELALVEVDGEASLHFTYTPGAHGWHQAVVTVLTDAGEDPSQVVTVRGRSLPPLASFSPALLDFGEVEPDSFATLAVQVVNEGPAALPLSALAVAPPFSLETALGSLGAGQVLSLQVGFRPEREAPAAGSLALSLGGQPIGAVGLRGNDCEGGLPAAYDRDGDGVTTCAGDCDDADPDVRPGALEQEDGVDQDCDGRVDNGTLAYDDDGDGKSEREGDCDDSDPSTGPHATERPGDGFDRDCDGEILNGAVDVDGDGFSPGGGDCDDTDPDRHPGAAEVPNGEDDDCDATADEGTPRYDDDGDGLSEDQGDCDDGDALVKPDAAERPNGRDDDCDGAVDEGTVKADDDGDGYTEEGGDCDDANAAIHPGAVELPGNSVDENCDGQRP
jgi:hypothetical protein